jgi:hypothetical protein
MNTKAAVILMIGLLGSPVAYNFTQPVADDWAFYGDTSKHEESQSYGFVLNRRTGQRFLIYGTNHPSAHTHTKLYAPPVDRPE